MSALVQRLRRLRRAHRAIKGAPTCLLIMLRVINATQSGTIAIFWGADSISGEGPSHGKPSCAQLRALSVSLPLLLPEGWSVTGGTTTKGLKLKRRKKEGQCERSSATFWEATSQFITYCSIYSKFCHSQCWRKRHETCSPCMVLIAF